MFRRAGISKRFFAAWSEKSLNLSANRGTAGRRNRCRRGAASCVSGVSVAGASSSGSGSCRWTGGGGAFAWAACLSDKLIRLRSESTFRTMTSTSWPGLITLRTLNTRLAANSET